MRHFPVWSRRIGVAEVERTVLARPSVLAPRGEHVAWSDVNPRYAMYLERVAAMGTTAPTIATRSAVRGFLRTDGELDYRVSQAQRLAHIFEERQDDPLGAVEFDNARKMCLEAGAASGWDIITEDMHRYGPMPHVGEGLDALLTELHRIGRLPSLSDAMRGAYDTLAHSSYPRATNHGWPTLCTTDAGLILHAAIASQLVASDFDLSCVKRVAGIYGLRGSLVNPHCVTFSRTGPTAKPAPTFAYRGGGVEVTGSITGTTPRRRHVNGVSAFANIILGPMAAAMKVLKKVLPGCFHGHPTDTLAYLRQTPFARQPLVLSDDLSGFDTSVSLDGMRVLGAILTKWFPFLKADVSWWLTVEAWPLLSGPIGSTSAGYLYSRTGGLTSGVRLTSDVGTLMNLDRVIHSCAEGLGLTHTAVVRKYLDLDIGVLVQGDDTGLLMPKQFDREAYTAATVSMGYKNAVLDGLTFLMRHFNLKEGNWVPLVSRLFQNTVWREHPARSLAIEALGWYAKTENASVNPYFPTLVKMLNDGAIVTRYGTKLDDRAGWAKLLAGPLKSELNDTLRDITANRSLKDDLLKWASTGDLEVFGDVANWLRPLSLDETELRSYAAAATEQDIVIFARWLATPVDDRPLTCDGRLGAAWKELKQKLTADRKQLAAETNPD